MQAVLGSNVVTASSARRDWYAARTHARTTDDGLVGLEAVRAELALDIGSHVPCHFVVDEVAGCIEIEGITDVPLSALVHFLMFSKQF